MDNEKVLYQAEIDHIIKNMKDSKQHTDKDDSKLQIISLEKLIPSNAVREQCIKEKHRFTVREQATLVCNNTELSNVERLELLDKIKKQIEAEKLPYKNLLNQIKTYTDRQLYLEKRFYSDEPGEYFKLSMWDYFSKKYEESDALFSSLENALKFAEEKRLSDLDTPQSKTEFIHPVKVTKHYMDNPYHEITCTYKRADSLFDVESYSINNIPFDSDFFENTYVDVPYPFRNGDLVKTKGTCDTGIFSSCKDEKEYKKNRKWLKDRFLSGETIDFSDVSCRVEYVESQYKNPEQKTFSHSHPLLTLLEYSEVSKKEKDFMLLKIGQCLMRGEGSLEALCNELLN